MMTLKLGTDEQPFGPRHLTVGATWTKLEFGWLNRTSMIEIVNNDVETILEVGCQQVAGVEGFAQLHPKMSMRLSPTVDLWVKSRTATSAHKITIMAWPE
jgi:CRISPR/Cas system type I-B associated protein Csh2 (Cas7 group RAMP superfamily)